MRYLMPVIFCFLNSFDCNSQNAQDLIRELSTERLYSFDVVEFPWKLDGKLQVILNEGINFLEERNLEASIANLDEFTKLDSTFWAAYYYRGVAHKLLRRFRKAELDFKRAMTLNRSSFEAIVEFGKVHHLRYNFKEAEKSYNAAIELNPKKSITYFLKGEIEFYKGNTRAAIRNYKMCLEKDSGLSDAKTKLAVIEIVREKSLEAGLPYLNEVLLKDTVNEVALMFRAIINSKREPKSSLLDLNRLVRKNPQSIQFLFYRGLLQIDLEDYESAFVDMRKVCQASKDDENEFIGQQTDRDKKIDVLNAGNYIVRVIYGLNEEEAKAIKKSFCLLLVGKFQESISTLDLLTNSKDLAVCLLLKAIAYEHMGKHKDAFQHYGLTLSLDNEIFDAHKKRCIYRSEIKDVKGAFEDLKEMTRIQPNSIVTYRLGGLIKISYKDFAGSIIDFTKYLKVDTSDADIWKQRGIARSKMGDKKGSNDDFRTALKINPRANEPLFDFVAQQYLEIRDTLNAIDILKEYVSRSHGHPIARLYLASVYADAKRWNLLKLELDSIYEKIPTLNAQGSIPSNFFYLKSRYVASVLDYQAALSLVNKSLEADPNNLASLYWRGKVYIKTDRPKKALKDFKILSESNYKDSREICRSLEATQKSQ